MANKQENSGFVCAHCGAAVHPLTNGSYRNHCPACLWSLHVDDVRPGDRASRCRGLMVPIGITRKCKLWQIVHRCRVCGKLQPNKIAMDTAQPDDFDALLALMSFS